MAVDAQWAEVVCMLPLDINTNDARGNATEFGSAFDRQNTVGNALGAGYALQCYGSSFNPHQTGPSVDVYVNLASNFSLQMAFYTEDGGHGSADSVLLQIGATGDSGALRIIANGTSNPCQLRVQHDAGAGWVDLIGFVATNITDDAWHWLQLDRVTNTFTLWIDGVQYSTETVAASPGGQGVYIGRASGVSQNLFLGWISQLRITSGSYRASHAVPIAPWPRPTLTGTVLDMAGLPVERVIFAFQRAQAVQAMSDPITGVYTAYPTSYDEHMVIRIDTDTDPPVDGAGVENGMIYDRVTPGSP